MKTLTFGEKFAILIFLVIVAVSPVKCQQVAATPTPAPSQALHITKHTNMFEQEDDGRWMFITVLDIQNDQILFSREDKKQVEVSFIFADKDTIFHIEKDHPKKFCAFMLFCIRHSYVYFLTQTPCKEASGPFKLSG